MLDLDEARETLLARRERIRRLESTISREESDLLAEREADWEDRSVSERSAGLLEKVGYAEHRQLQMIDEALARMGTGTWGICDSCGCHIDPRRLEARPEATICSDCASA